MAPEMMALMLSSDPDADMRHAYAERIARAAADRTRPVFGKAGRILLVGYNGACNTGADLRTGEIVRQLRETLGDAAIELGVLAMGTRPLPDWGAMRVERIEGYSPDAVRDLCARYDGIVVCEGSLFTSTFSDGLATLLTAFLGMARAMGKPAVAYGAEADEMTPEVAAFVRDHAREALVIARNAPSQARMAALGIAAELGTDTGWRYRPTHPERAAAALHAMGWDGAMPVMAICPANPFRWPLIADPARALQASMTGATLADHHQGMMFFQPAEVAATREAALVEKIATAVEAHAARTPVFLVIVGMEALDAPICAALAERLGAALPLVAGAVAADLLVAVLRRADRLVSARYHAILLSMSAGVPAIGLAYDQRVPALLDEAGYPELTLRID